jgi:nitroimidazol reductase NimA-like FMN-containing flavoprotein (pyridoxamine 5'-phosphate oxidase superfamily)
MPDLDSPVEEMTAEECWSHLEEEEFGRLAYRLVDEVHIVPVNFVVDGRTLLFRTSAGNKLLAAALSSDVAFEIDRRDEHSAWSVVVRGHLRRLEEDEQHRVDNLPEHSWISTRRDEVIDLVPEVVTGRKFLLRHPE